MESKGDFGITPPTWMIRKAETKSEPDTAPSAPKQTQTTPVKLNIQEIPPAPQPKKAEVQPYGDIVLKIHKADFEFPDVVIPCAHTAQAGNDLAVGSSYWVVLGRAPDVLEHTGLCLIIPNPTVSRTHAAILNHEGYLYVCDLSENNPPTIVRGKKLLHATHEPTALFTSDYLGLGDVLFTFAELPPRLTS